jgi:hypothetical protein
VGTLGSGFTQNSTADVIYTNSHAQPDDAKANKYVFLPASFDSNCVFPCILSNIVFPKSHERSRGSAVPLPVQDNNKFVPHTTHLPVHANVARLLKLLEMACQQIWRYPEPNKNFPPVASSSSHELAVKKV